MPADTGFHQVSSATFHFSYFFANHVVREIGLTPGLARRRAAPPGPALTSPSCLVTSSMEYTVEGEDLSPSELATGEWETVLSLQDRARRLKSDAAAASTPQRMHGEGKSASAAPVKKKRPPAPRRKAPLPRLPAGDYKIVCRPRGWNLNTFVPRQLERAACDAVHVPFDVAQTEDSTRVNPTNNTITISTPDRQRAAAYASLQTLRIEGRDFEVASYVAAPDDSVRGVIYQAFDGSSPDEVRQGFMNRNPGAIVVDARRLGRSKSIQITFQGTKIPSQIYYWGSIFRVHPYQARVETCFNCRKVGHRADVCFKPKAYLCRR